MSEKTKSHQVRIEFTTISEGVVDNHLVMMEGANSSEEMTAKANTLYSAIFTAAVGMAVADGMPASFDEYVAAKKAPAPKKKRAPAK